MVRRFVLLLQLVIENPIFALKGDDHPLKGIGGFFACDARPFKFMLETFLWSRPSLAAVRLKSSYCTPPTKNTLLKKSNQYGNHNKENASTQNVFPVIFHLTQKSFFLVLSVK